MITDFNGLDWSLLSADKIRAKIESLVSYQALNGEDPSNLALYLIAIGRQDLLAQLFLYAYKEKEFHFWSRDFTLEINKEEAEKNAYNCIYSGKPEYAAAFFLVSGSFLGAVSALRVANMNLAILLYRIHSGECYPWIYNSLPGKSSPDFDLQLESARQLLEIESNPLFVAMTEG